MNFPKNCILVGETEEGKSRFINLIAGVKKAEISQDRIPYIDKVYSYTVDIPGDGQFIFFDTPGLNGTNLNDKVHLDIIKEKCVGNFNKQIKYILVFIKYN